MIGAETQCQLPPTLHLPRTARLQSPLILSFFLSAEGSLEPQIEDLINRINDLQHAKKKSNEELGETQTLLETLHRELDSLNGEKVHLEEVLRKKQEALRILQLHCHRKESQAQRSHVQEQLEDLMGQHKDLWEFQQVLEQRLACEIRALQSSKEQLQTEENLARAKLERVEQRLRSSPAVEGALAVTEAEEADGGAGETRWASPHPGAEPRGGRPGSQSRARPGSPVRPLREGPGTGGGAGSVGPPGPAGPTDPQLQGPPRNKDNDLEMLLHLQA
ncbi:synaptonemal complex central element protein 1-like isoform X1 [Pipistrellus kuhlii]|uniref:synaptonemal complex central element protein 1-like isoform X1 n=1 Tax=Pipistrellus kuhlii TaxID=59472 RepID=UPI00174EEBA7|nr:synaptonemal complex central element protein 1-like isoform X1 [Pipistrellus kuhlii]